MAVRTIPPPSLHKRMERAFWLILCCYLGLIGRLLYLQGAEGRALRSEATRMRRQKITLPSRRGGIYGRDGRPLAVSLYSGVVGFDPKLVQTIAGDPKKSARIHAAFTAAIPRVASLLNLDRSWLEARIRTALAEYNPNHPVRFVPIKRDVPLAVAQQIADHSATYPGFGVDDQTKRVYSSGTATAQVVGYVQPNQAPVAGLELSCRRWTLGHDGCVFAEVDNRRREIPETRRSMTPARDGLDVYTTLDPNVEQIATEEAQKIVDKYHPEGVSVVAVEPASGDVLAMVSLPSFDPNPVQHRPHVSDAERFERCASRLYEPGSTLKAITVAGALDAGLIGLHSTFYCKGTLQVGNKTIHCVLHGAAERGGHGVVDPKLLLRHSCNVGAAQIGIKIGPRALFSIDRKFGLLDPMHLGLPAEQHGRLSFDRNERIFTDAKAARVAFGHSITTTPLQVTMAYAALANGGLLMKPRLVASVRDADGHVKQEWNPVVVRRVISAQTAEEMRDMLNDVVTNGTGKVAAIPGYNVAGKTGTAKKYRRGAYVGSFVGFLPAGAGSRPRVVLLVAVDEPHGAYYGAEVAAPAFHAIAERLMALWRVPQDDPSAGQYRQATAKIQVAAR